MKKLILIGVLAALIIIGMLHSNGVFAMDEGTYILMKQNKDAKPQKPPVAQCPKTLMTDTCTSCHDTPSFKVKEIDPVGHLSLPYKTEILITKDNVKQGYYLVDDINGNQFKDGIRYLCDRHGLMHVIVDVKSFGGSLFDAWEMQGIMAQYEKRGVIFETRCSSYAMSAGFIVLVAGTQGHRNVSSKAELMFHELWTFEMFKLSTPSGTEDQAKILRHIQDTASTWLATKSKLSKEEIDERIHKREWWMNGKQAHGVGFVDGFLD